jgi:O-antigen/teichoic acid export membrane protein
MAIRVAAISPVAWVTIGRVTQQVLWLALFAVLAPILGPRPYGLFSIVMVFVGFCELVLIEGATEALITVNELDHLHTTTANLVNGAIALGFSLVMCALAPAIGVLFHDDEITSLMWVLAPFPVLAALSATPIAILRRSMQYKLLTIRSTVGLTIGGLLGIALALAGAGVWALAVQALAQRLAEVTIAWMSVPVRPGFTWSRPHFNEMKPVGMNVFAAQMMIFLSGQMPRVIIGYILGPTEVGLFALSSRFLDIILFTTVLPRSIVGRIELRDWKSGSPEFQRTFAAITQKSSILSFPLFLGAAALVPDLFRVWLGERWMAGIIPTQLILLSGVPFVFFYCIDAALLAANLSAVFKQMATVQTLTIVATVLCAAPFGLDLTCLSLAIRSWLLFPFFLWLVCRSCCLPLYGFLRLPIRSLLGAVVMAGLLTLPSLRPAWFDRRFDFVFLVVLGMMFYGVFLYGFSRGQLKSLLAGLFVHQS